LAVCTSFANAGADLSLSHKLSLPIPHRCDDLLVFLYSVKTVEPR
jgi:hypothetical protein